MDTWFFIKKPNAYTGKKTACSIKDIGQTGCLYVDKCKLNNIYYLNKINSKLIKDINIKPDWGVGEEWPWPHWHR